MRTIILSIALLAGLNAVAQDTLYSKGLNNLTTWTVERIDTSKVIMLYADTSNINGIRHPNDPEIIWHKDYNCYWRFGYLVTGTSYSHTFIPYYLNENKEPLRKSIIVFQTIQLK